MKPAFMARKSDLDRKPPHGAPCNSCGLCCRASICSLGSWILKRPQLPGPCPALEFGDDGRSRCGIVAHPDRYALAKTLEHGAETMSAAAAHLIGSGTGCDARMNGEPTNTAFYRFLLEWDAKNAAKTERSARLWGYYR